MRSGLDAIRGQTKLKNFNICGVFVDSSLLLDYSRASLQRKLRPGPVVEPVMGRALDEFGGGLRVYQGIIILTAVLCFAELVGLYYWRLGFSTFRPDWNATQRTVSTVYTSVTDVVQLYLYYRLFRMLKIKSPDTPNRITRLAFWITVLWIFFYLIHIPVDRFLHQESFTYKSWKESASDAGRIIGSYFVWVYYFFKSKRVLAYYGANADLYY